jgi:hypothetical protein
MDKLLFSLPPELEVSQSYTVHINSGSVHVSYLSLCRRFLCWIAGQRHACLGGSIQSHKNKDPLYGGKSLESGRIRQIVYKYRSSPTVRSIDSIIPMHHSKRSILQVDILYLLWPLAAALGGRVINLASLKIASSRSSLIWQPSVTGEWLLRSHSLANGWVSIPAILMRVVLVTSYPIMVALLQLELFCLKVPQLLAVV